MNTFCGITFLLLAITSVQLTHGSMWSVTSVYNGNSCTGATVAVVATVGTCTTVSTGTCSCSTTAQGTNCVQQSCQNSVPSVPASSVGFTLYSAADCPAGAEQFVVAFNPGSQQCITLSNTTSASVSCSGGTLTFNQWSTSGSCSGTANQPQTTSTGCTTNGPTSVLTQCNAGTCFHETTEITYGDRTVKLDQLQRNEVSDCVVPHVVREQGVVITAKCGPQQRVLRLTGAHLVYTSNGLKAAKDVTQSDQVFADLDEKKPCRVVSVQSEKSPQKYFGLNCISSDVLAQGIKTSTFEKLHRLPSAWMSTVGRVFGIDAASRWGDALAEKFGF